MDSYSAEEECAAQRGKLTCPKVWNWRVVLPVIKLRSDNSPITAQYCLRPEEPHRGQERGTCKGTARSALRSVHVAWLLRMSGKAERHREGIEKCSVYVWGENLDVA